MHSSNDPVSQWHTHECESTERAQPSFENGLALSAFKQRTSFSFWRIPKCSLLAVSVLSLRHLLAHSYTILFKSFSFSQYIMASAYDILTPSRKQIRLIQLSPSTSPGDILSCTSHTISLLDNPQYVALSYCWGSPADKIKIEFNGIPDLPIPRNLDSALRQLRQEFGAYSLWADSICINQDPKTPEKNQQVAMMGEIYAQASSTIIWLGEAADNSDLAMETISSLYERDVWAVNDDTLSSAQFDAIADLNARLWWSRVWVVQELLLSPKPRIMCGTKSVPIEAFIHLDDLRRGYHRPTGRTIDNALQPSRYLFKQHAFSQILHHYFNDRRRIEAGVVNLEEWVVVVNDFQARDPRDKIYGLLGLGTK